MSAPTLRVLSLGAGVQSSALYLMAVHGEFAEDRPTVAIFADTQWEPAEVYAWLDELERIGGATIPIRRVSAGNVRVSALRNPATERHVSLPLYIRDDRGGAAPLLRQCTQEFKIRPVHREMRRILGVRRAHRVPPGVRAEQWMGISLDEATRMRDSRENWITNVYPLIDRRMSRHDCVNWLTRNGYGEPPKSACIGCPYTSDARWREMQTKNPAAFQDAVTFDAQIRHHLPQLRGGAFLHRSARPLGEIDFRSDEDRGQTNFFENECEGMCGV